MGDTKKAEGGEDVEVTKHEQTPMMPSTPKVPSTPKMRQSADKSMSASETPRRPEVFSTPMATSTPMSRRQLKLDESSKGNESEIFRTPSREPANNQSPVVEKSIHVTPRVVSSPAPSSPVREYHQLKSHCNPGPKDIIATRVDEPKSTRSGKSYAMVASRSSRLGGSRK